MEIEREAERFVLFRVDGMARRAHTISAAVPRVSTSILRTSLRRSLSCVCTAPLSTSVE